MVNHTGRRVWSLIAVLLVSVFLIGCTASTGSTGKSDGGNHASSSPGKNTGSSPKGGDDHTADPLPDPKIKLADDVVVVRRTKGKTVKGGGDDGASILLDGTNAEVKKLDRKSGV